MTLLKKQMPLYLTFTGLRSIQYASTRKNIQDKLGVKSTSLGSLSEASHVFDPQLLTHIINERAHYVNQIPFQERFNNLDMTLVAVDGTMIKALPKMLWALWMDEDHRAAKMHLEFDILKGIPLEARVTDANTSEIAQLESMLSPGKLYCLDAGYRKYRFLNTILQRSSSFVVRLHDNASYELIQERALCETDLKAGIEFDRAFGLEVQTRAMSSQDLSE